MNTGNQWLNLKEMLLGPVNNLRYVIRFGTCFRIHQESVAEHSFYTAFYAMMLAREMGLPQERIGKICQSALLHDVEECVTNDFPRPFKYSDPTLKANLSKASELAAMDVFSGMVLGASVISGERQRVKTDLFNDWFLAKDGDDGAILEFADFLSALGYVANEVKNGNRSIYPYCKDMQKFRNRFDDARFKVIPAHQIEAMSNLMIEAFRDQ